jgi:tetratricopeptide (TPR) repeat protein
MSRRPAMLLAIAAMFALAASRAAPLSAQQSFLLAYVPPPLPRGLDRNDADVLYAQASDAIAVNAEAADSILAWAARLNPAWAAPLYGQAMCQEGIWGWGARVSAALTGTAQLPTTSEYRFYDSLMLAAQTRDPFPDRSLEARLMRGPAQSVRTTIWLGKRKVKLPGEVARGEMEQVQGDYKAALADWATALRKMPDLYFLHTYRAQAFYALQAYDSVVAELRIVADTLAAKERNDLVYSFEGRAMTLYSIAHTQVQRDDYQAARQAYQDALTVDLGFYMAHARLAGIALIGGDTATAISELGSAVQLNETDPSILYFYGYLLLATGRTDSAEAQFRKAITVDPFYAAPYEMLGRILEARGKNDEALAAYQGFIDHAPRNDPRLIWNVTRAATLSRQAPAPH